MTFWLAVATPTLSMAAITFSTFTSGPRPCGVAPTSTSDVTRSGYWSVKRWAMVPPMERPTSTQDSISSSDNTRSTSDTNASIV